MDYRKLRRVRGVEKLVEYLDSMGCPIGLTTIFKFLREKRIPCIRPSEKNLLFDLDAIDRWLTIEDTWEDQERKAEHATFKSGINNTSTRGVCANHKS